MDTGGSVIWAKKSCNGKNGIYSFDMDKRGNVYTSGAFCDSIVYFDTIAVKNIRSSPLCTFYISKYNSDGMVQWVKIII